MAEPKIKMLKAKAATPPKVGESADRIKANVKSAREQAALLNGIPVNAQPRAEAPRRSAFSTIEAKKRAALGEDYGQGFDSDKPYEAPLPMSEVPMDLLRGAGSGGLNAAEGLVGMPGDIADMRYDLARWINRKLSAEGGGNRAVGNVIDSMQQYDPLSRFLPSSQEIGENVTDPLLAAMGGSRPQPKTPWGQAVDFGVSQIDPLAVAGKGVDALRLLGKVR